MLTKTIVARAMALGAVASLLASACGGAGPTATPLRKPPPTAPPAATATPAPPAAPRTQEPTATPRPAPTATPVPPTPTIVPKRGGVLNLRMIQSWPVRDPWDTRGWPSVQWTGSVLNRLVLTNPYNFKTSEEIIGDLARAWRITGDGRTYTFDLNRGVRWHDGRPFSADDVVYTYNRVKTPPSATVTYQKTQFEVVDGIAAMDVNTVVVALKAPSLSWLRVAALVYNHIIPAHIPDMDAFSKAVVGTGPFKFKSEQRDALIEVERNPAYFKEGLPYLDGIRYFVIPDPGAAGAAFRAGRLHGANGTFDTDFMVPQAEILKRTFPDLQEQRPLGSRVELIPNKQSALGDKRVRQAVSLGLDRQAFDRAWVTEGTGIPLASPLVPPSRGGNWGLPDEEMARWPGFNPATKAADVAKAKELLRDAGFASGLNIKVTGIVHPFYGPAAEIAANFLKPIGITASLELRPALERFPFLSRGAFDLELNTSTINFDDPADYLTSVIKTGSPLNYGKWSFPRMDAILDEQDRTFDEAKRRQLLQELQRLILDELPVIPILFFPRVIFWRAELKNVAAWYYPFSPGFIWEQAWLDSK